MALHKQTKQSRVTLSSQIMNLTNESGSKAGVLKQLLIPDQQRLRECDIASRPKTELQTN